MIEPQLQALAVGTRRDIYTLLAEHPRTVGEIASRLPVSRPAVSQHLKVLAEAGLVRVASVGARRLYSVEPDGLNTLRGWVEEMWEQAMSGFVVFARREKERQMVDAVVKVVEVPGDPERVFGLFTERISDWWPLASHSVMGEAALEVRVEPGLGGRIYELAEGGVEHDWGRVTVWQPGQRVAFTWHPGLPPDQATRVTISFTATAAGTRVELVHDGWESRDAEARDGYDTGWDFVLGRLPGVAATTG